MCLVAAAAIAGTLAVDVAASSLDAFTILGPSAILAFSVVGALIAPRRPDNPIGWILCGVGLSFALGSLAGEYSTYSLITEPGSLPGGNFMAWLGTWIWPPGIILVFTYLLLLFPDGRLPSRRWRPVAWLAAVALVMTVIPVAVTAWAVPGRMLASIGEDAPAGSPTPFKVAFNIQIAGVLLLFVLGLASAAPSSSDSDAQRVTNERSSGGSPSPAPSLSWPSSRTAPCSMSAETSSRVSRS
jgi:uncharacterized membrane protein YhaH (DUF805 family)